LEFVIVKTRTIRGQTRLAGIASRSFAIQYRVRRNGRSTAAIRRQHRHDFILNKGRRAA
jgi:hypothetical protein